MRHGVRQGPATMNATGRPPRPAASTRSGRPLSGQVPVQAIQALPYILTVILLAGFIGKSVPPKAGGVPYVKER